MPGNELMHWGVQGMHWGERRYQNPDGSLTPAGRIHYGVGKARDAGKTVGKAVGKAAVKTGKAVGKVAATTAKNAAIKRVPSVFLTDEQLMQRNFRLNLEKNREATKKEIAKMHRGRQVVASVLEEGVKTVGRKGFETLADKMFNRDKQVNYAYFLEHPEEIRTTSALKGVKDFADLLKAARESRDASKQYNYDEIKKNPNNASIEQLEWVAKIDKAREAVTGEKARAEKTEKERKEQAEKMEKELKEREKETRESYEFIISHPDQSPPSKLIAAKNASEFVDSLNNSKKRTSQASVENTYNRGREWLQNYYIYGLF